MSGRPPIFFELDLKLWKGMDGESTIIENGNVDEPENDETGADNDYRSYT